MDSKIVTGIGNIYAAEALFRAQIHPLMPANLLTLQDCKILVKAIKAVLQFAILQGGTTLRDYVNSDGMPGYFAQKLQVYGRFNLPCKRCHTILNRLSIIGRSTIFCPQCQKFDPKALVFQGR